MSVGRGSVAVDPAAAGPAPTVGLLVQVGLLAALAASVGLGVAGWTAGVAYAITGWWLLSRGLRHHRSGGWGPADTVTLSRAILVGGVTALVADSLTGPVPVMLLTVLAAVALALDGVDGQVARRTGTASRFGARFDMETDSILVLVLAVFVAASLGWWVLLVGAFRYAFGLAGWAMPWLRAPLPPRLSRKMVAVVQGIVLVVGAAGVLPLPVVLGSLGLVLTLLVWSFAVDAHRLWLLRRHAIKQNAVDITGVGLVGQRDQMLRKRFLGNPTIEGQPVRLAQRQIESVRA